MLAWFPDDDVMEQVRRPPMPPGIEYAVMPKDAVGHRDIGRVEFLHAPLSRARMAEALPHMTGLKTVQIVSAGTDWIEDLIPPGVQLCNAGDVRSAPVADWVMAVLLFWVQDLARAEAQRRARTWERWTPHELTGKRILIVGHGAIGRALSRRLAPFDAVVTKVASRARDDLHGADELPDLLPDADAVVLLAPLTETTRGMADAAFLARMADGALLVNGGRGELVRTDALLDELRSERITAALDVTDPEPLPEGHPLWKAPGLLLTPHIAGASAQSAGRMIAFVRDQLTRAANGDPLEAVV